MSTSITSLLVGTLAGTPWAPPADPVDQVISHVVAADPVHVLRYWTPARMRNATARRRLIPGLLSSVRQSAPRKASDGAPWRSRGAVRGTTGKVFFTMGGRDFLCSASTVRSRNRDLVVTAAHCVKDGTRAWADNWIFVPGYRDGSRPHGEFTARHLYVSRPWSHSADDNFDVAMVALRASRGRHVTDEVGAQAIAFGSPRKRQVYAFGYPSSGSYDGERLIYCSGKPKRDPRGFTRDQGLRCDMTQGSSGGPWLAKFDTARGSGTITSVSSFKYTDDSSTMYGPNFGDTERRLYEKGQRA